MPVATSPQTFSNQGDRVRLSEVALRALPALAEQWRLSDRQAALLLGVEEDTWGRIKHGTWGQSLSQDQLMRASAMVGTYKALRMLFADGMADRWPKLANQASVFQGRTPVEAMVEGGIPTMIEVRRYVDALQVGL